jgi:hypothetical protein
MTPSSVEHLLHAVIFSIFIGYQMAIQMAINVVVFSIFNIVTRDVPHCDQPRCFVPNICTARALMRWVIRLFCQSPDMGDCDYKDLHDQVSGWHLNKMATAIFSSIPSGAHDPMFNGRSDLLQSCSIMAHSPVGLPQGSCLYTSARELMRWLSVGSLRYMYYVSSKHNMIPSKKETAPGTTANSGTYLLQPHRTHQLKSQLRLQIISFIHYGGVTVCTVQWGCHGDYAYTHQRSPVQHVHSSSDSNTVIATDITSPLRAVPDHFHGPG